MSITLTQEQSDSILARALVGGVTARMTWNPGGVRTPPCGCAIGYIATELYPAEMKRGLNTDTGISLAMKGERNRVRGAEYIAITVERERERERVWKIIHPSDTFVLEAADKPKRFDGWHASVYRVTDPELIRAWHAKIIAPLVEEVV